MTIDRAMALATQLYPEVATRGYVLQIAPAIDCAPDGYIIVVLGPDLVVQCVIPDAATVESLRRLTPAGFAQRLRHVGSALSEFQTDTPTWQGDLPPDDHPQ